MGLFTPKTVTCARCGKEFQTRIGFLNICDACAQEQLSQDEQRKQKAKNVKGYVQYAKAMKWEPYSENQLDEIAAHKATLVNRYQCENGISKEELKAVSDKYSKLSDAQAAEVLQRISNSTFNYTGGCAYTSQFFVPLAFEETIVSMDDVFAVALATDYHNDLEHHESVLCAIFTNDPYIPVFPMIVLLKLGFFEVFHSKKGRQGVDILFNHLCPNLTYPVQSISQLKKQVKQEGIVRGNIAPEAMLSAISKISFSEGVFKGKYTEPILPESTEKMLESMGYIPEDKIRKIMRRDSILAGSFWDRIEKKM